MIRPSASALNPAIADDVPRPGPPARQPHRAAKATPCPRALELPPPPPTRRRRPAAARNRSRVRSLDVEHQPLRHRARPLLRKEVPVLPRAIRRDDSALHPPVESRVESNRLARPVAAGCAARRLRRRRRLGHDDRRPAPSAELHQPRRGRVVHRAQAQRRALLGSARPVQPVKRSHVVDEQQPATAAGRTDSLSSSTSSSRGDVIGRGWIGRERLVFLAARSRSGTRAAHGERLKKSSEQWHRSV